MLRPTKNRPTASSLLKMVSMGFSKRQPFFRPLAKKLAIGSLELGSRVELSHALAFICAMQIIVWAASGTPGANDIGSHYSTFYFLTQPIQYTSTDHEFMQSAVSSLGQANFGHFDLGNTAQDFSGDGMGSHEWNDRQ